MNVENRPAKKGVPYCGKNPCSKEDFKELIISCSFLKCCPEKVKNEHIKKKVPKSAVEENVCDERPGSGQKGTRIKLKNAHIEST
jgi:hypothetical protein